MAERTFPLYALVLAACFSTGVQGSRLPTVADPARSSGPKSAGALFPAAFLKADNAGPGDQFGLALAMDGDFAVVGAPAEDGNGSSPADDSANRAGAAYVLRRDTNGSWFQEAYLKASNAEESDSFGIAVAISGSRVVVGASGEDSSNSPDNNRLTNSGAAYVFERQVDGTWAETAFLKASNRGRDDFFGAAVAISGDTILVGAPAEDGDGTSDQDNSRSDSGAAYAFVLDPNDGWIQTDYIKADLVGAGDEFGASMALDTDLALIGAPEEDSRDAPNDNRYPGSGAVYVFARGASDSWSQQALLKSENSDAGDHFGTAVALAGTAALIGSPNEDGDGIDPAVNTVVSSGAAYVFSGASGTWVQTDYLKASNGESGDEFGGAVDLHGDRLIVGAGGEDDIVTSSGAAYVFELAESGAWTETDILKHVDPGDRDDFGIAVAVFADRLGVGVFSDDASADGGPFDNSVLTSGAAFVFEPGYTIGGTVVGLEDIRLRLSNNGENVISINDSGPFTLPTPMVDGATYDVEVFGQPFGGRQTCVVTNGQGTVNGSDVTDILVTCTTNTYTVGGTVNNLQGGGLILQNNGGDDLAISADGMFSFPTALEKGEAYQVTVLQQPQNPRQTCSVFAGWGTVAGEDVTDVVVTCATVPFTVGGTVSGLQGGGLNLSNNAIDPLQVNADGPFTFGLAVPDGGAYDVTIASQPEDPPQTCVIANGSGIIDGADVTDVSISCEPGQVSVGGTVTGLEGAGLVLRNNGADALVVNAGGPFVFPGTVAIGDAFDVTVTAQPTLPTQECTVENGSGMAGPVNVTDIVVRCVTVATDLMITKTDGVGEVPFGGLLTYTITVTNLGPTDVIDARVTDVLPPVLSDATWTCSADPGAACAATGVGDIDTFVDMQAGTGVVFTLQAIVGTGVSVVQNEARVRVPVGVSEINMGDNSDLDTTNTAYVFGGGGGSFETDPEAVLRDAVLNGINAVRASAIPAPVPALPDLVWNPDLAAVARAWADGCQFGFNANRDLAYAALNGGNVAVGETIHATSSNLDDATAAGEAILAWRLQAADYDYATDTCSSGTTCSAYTQLVWRDSTAVGCAVAACPAIVGGSTGTGTYTVCNFAPGGNVQGQQPY